MRREYLLSSVIINDNWSTQDKKVGDVDIRSNLEPVDGRGESSDPATRSILGKQSRPLADLRCDNE